MFLLVVFAVLATTASAQTDRDCYCLSTSGVNVRDAPCGNVIRSESSGCWEDLKESESCSLSGTIYMFRKVDYGSAGGWIADDYLNGQKCADDGDWDWQEGWSDIGYNWLIGEDGRAYEGRGWGKVGAHTSGFNDVGVAISVIGDFTNNAPSSSAKAAIENLIACARNEGVLASTYKMWGHRDAGATACPGDAFYPQVRGHPHYCSRGPSADNPSKPC